MDLLHEQDGTRARSFKGYRGIPTSSLARELVHRGHFVSVVSASYAGVTRLERFRGDSLTIDVVPGRARARHCARDMWSHERKAVTEVLRGIGPDIVHAHWTYEFALAALASELPTLVTAHDAPLTVLRRFRDPYRAARLALAVWVRARKPRLTAVSPYLAEQWRREMHWHRDLAVIPNMTPFAPQDTKHDKNGSQRLVTVADSSRLKNVRTGLQAWSIVLQSFPMAELHLVGHGLGPSDDLALWAGRRSLRRQVFWHGAIGRDEVEKLLGTATALLHPSLEEACPLVVLEAMTSGVPVVGGEKSGGVPWTIGEAGVLTDVRSPAALAASVVDLLGSSERRLSLGEKGRCRVFEVFSPKAVTDAYEEQYDVVLRSRSKNPRD